MFKKLGYYFLACVIGIFSLPVLLLVTSLKFLLSPFKEQGDEVIWFLISQMKEKKKKRIIKKANAKLAKAAKSGKSSAKENNEKNPPINTTD